MNILLPNTNPLWPAEVYNQRRTADASQRTR